MISGTRIFGLLAGVACPLALIFAPGAIAQQRTLAGSQAPVWTRPWIALDRCAAYGPEFTSVEGTDACVRIGGHVRVEFGAQNFGHARDNGWGRAGTAPAAMRTDGYIGGDPSGFPASQHLRLRQTDAPADGSYLR